jgi:toluene monooxygenase system protein A
MSIIDRVLGGDIQPMNLQGALEYMGMEGVAELGKDAHGYAWLDKVKASVQKAS